MKYFDYIIVGSGIAGLYTALLAKELGNVLILTKGSIDDCNTKYAQGGIAVPLSKNDSPELHFRDTISAGDGLCDVGAVHILTNEATDRIADLIKYGVPFDTQDGEIALTREAAHSVPRIVHAGGDATGEHIETALSNQVRNSPITVMEHCLATEIITHKNKIKGIKALNCTAGSTEEYECRYIILATGGAGQLFQYTTNSDVATGDGNALAFQAGAEMIDMEFFQFHPTAIRLPGVIPFLISEAVRGEGGVLRDVNSYAFMSDYAVDGDLAPRDIVARGILNQMRKTNASHVFLDVTHIPPRSITARFPHIYRFCLENGLDITKEPIPVAPAAHYFMGGVKVNTWGETNLNGLFAAGETACTGVHGANRLASNSLLEVVVFSKRIIERTVNPDISVYEKDTIKTEYCTVKKRDVSDDGIPALNLPALQSLLWNRVGIVRSGEKLMNAANTLSVWQSSLPKPNDRQSYELNNLIINARLMVEAALLREESRGAHFRTDFPKPSPEWQKRIVFLRTNS